MNGVIYALDSIARTFRQAGVERRALDGVTLRVARGEHVALIGPSGGGKSTLFRVMNATLRPTGGRLFFDGRDVAAMRGPDIRAMRRQIGTVYQQHHLVPSLTALDNTTAGALGRWSLAHTLRAMVRPAAADVARALHALECVGLADCRHARVADLSGGQQQRVAIARVLMQAPQVILADEPVASLDPGLALHIIRLLIRIAADDGRTLVVSLHAVDLARRHFPRIVALDRGRVVFDGPSSDVHDGLLASLYRASGDSAIQHAHADGVASTFDASR